MLNSRGMKVEWKNKLMNRKRAADAIKPRVNKTEMSLKCARMLNKSVDFNSEAWEQNYGME